MITVAYGAILDFLRPRDVLALVLLIPLLPVLAGWDWIKARQR